MKPLVGLSMLFLSLSQAQFHSFGVWTTCIDERLTVIVEKNIFRNGTVLQPNQVILGNGCQVTSSSPYRLYLSYSLSQCGIDVQITPDMIYIRSVLYFLCEERLPCPCVTIPLVCQIARSLSRQPIYLVGSSKCWSSTMTIKIWTLDQISGSFLCP
ncbi:oocyte-secreted protein 1-like [Monodelphis domestica]|uniref:oocyte-secreted protein 1-like n=1 Tax=Monodelphis domestica TaxID=13616 RepID=UPI0024E239D7|nr:oocyte-secreted protein 1-like [Monodelphis domestica]